MAWAATSSLSMSINSVPAGVMLGGSLLQLKLQLGNALPGDHEDMRRFLRVCKEEAPTVDVRANGGNAAVRNGVHGALHQLDPQPPDRTLLWLRASRQLSAQTDHTIAAGSRGSRTSNLEITPSFVIALRTPTWAFFFSGHFSDMTAPGWIV
jgi:hypothetical protein